MEDIKVVDNVVEVEATTSTNIDTDNDQNFDNQVADNVSDNEMADEKPDRQKKEKEHRIRYDFESGHVLLRVSSTTEPKKLGGAIVKHFKDGARALVVSFIGATSQTIALKGVCSAQQYLPKETVSRLAGKSLAIVPAFHEFKNENGPVNTMKFTLYLVDELKPN